MTATVQQYFSWCTAPPSPTTQNPPTHKTPQCEIKVVAVAEDSPIGRALRYAQPCPDDTTQQQAPLNPFKQRLRPHLAHQLPSAFELAAQSVTLWGLDLPTLLPDTATLPAAAADLLLPRLEEDLGAARAVGLGTGAGLEEGGGLLFLWFVVVVVLGLRSWVWGQLALLLCSLVPAAHSQVSSPLSPHRPPNSSPPPNSPRHPLGAQALHQIRIRACAALRRCLHPGPVLVHRARRRCAAG